MTIVLNFIQEKQVFFQDFFYGGTFSSMFYLFSLEDVKDCMFNYYMCTTRRSY